MISSFIATESVTPTVGNPYWMPIENWKSTYFSGHLKETESGLVEETLASVYLYNIYTLGISCFPVNVIFLFAVWAFIWTEIHPIYTSKMNMNFEHRGSASMFTWNRVDVSI